MPRAVSARRGLRLVAGAISGIATNAVVAGLWGRQQILYNHSPSLPEGFYVRTSADLRSTSSSQSQAQVLGHRTEVTVGGEQLVAADDTEEHGDTLPILTSFRARSRSSAGVTPSKAWRWR